MTSSISLIIPTYNEEKGIAHHLSYHQDRFNFNEMIVVDGGSTDGTQRMIEQSDFDGILDEVTPGNRSRQLRKGVQLAESETVLFLHADCYLPGNFTVSMLSRTNKRWGWFDLEFQDTSWKYRLLGNMISLRSAIFSSPTGDQAIWVEQNLLAEIGGVPQMPLMEDVELSRRLSQTAPGHRFKKVVKANARRWKDDGYIKTILTMWTLKVAYYAGFSPSELAEIYYGRTTT